MLRGAFFVAISAILFDIACQLYKVQHKVHRRV